MSLSLMHLGLLLLLVATFSFASPLQPDDVEIIFGQASVGSGRQDKKYPAFLDGDVFQDVALATNNNNNNNNNYIDSSVAKPGSSSTPSTRIV